MENIDHMGRNSLEALSRDNLTEKGRHKLARDIICGAATLCLLAVGLIYTYVLGRGDSILPHLLYRHRIDCQTAYPQFKTDRL